MGIREGGKLNAIVPGNQISAIIPASFDDAVRIARLAVMAGLYKASYGTSDEALEAQAVMAILKGMELQIMPMQALECIAIVNGKSCIYGDLLPALLWTNGFDLEETIENEDTPEMTAICTVTRPGGKQISRKFSVTDAKKARLWDERTRVTKKGKNGTTYDADNDAAWFKYPKRMLQMRARGFAVRDGAADVTRGMYLREEMDDMNRADDARDITPKRSLMIPSADFLGTASDEPQRTAEEAQPSPPEDLQDAIPEDPKAVLEELSLALIGAKTTDEADQAWDEMSERLSLAGRDAFTSAQVMHGRRLEELAATATVSKPRVRIPTVGA
jgi:hypothetical protein